MKTNSCQKGYKEILSDTSGEKNLVTSTLLLLTPEEFFASVLANYHWNLSDSKSPQVSRTLLSFQAVLNNVVV